MAGLDPAIHVFLQFEDKDVDARVKPGHDESGDWDSHNIALTDLLSGRDQPHLRGVIPASSEGTGRFAAAPVDFPPSRPKAGR